MFEVGAPWPRGGGGAAFTSGLVIISFVLKLLKQTHNDGYVVERDMRLCRGNERIEALNIT